MMNLYVKQFFLRIYAYTQKIMKQKKMIDVCKKRRSIKCVPSILFSTEICRALNKSRKKIKGKRTLELPPIPSRAP